MTKRLTLLKFAILTCIACNLIVTASDQLVAAKNKPAFPSSPKTFSANKYGAKPDAQMINTKAIQAAIDACAKAGGGMVVFDPGSYDWLTRDKRFALSVNRSAYQTINFI